MTSLRFLSLIDNVELYQLGLGLVISVSISKSISILKLYCLASFSFLVCKRIFRVDSPGMVQ